MIHRRYNRRATRLPEFQGGICIFCHKDLLNRKHIRLKLRDDFRHAGINTF